MFLFLPPILIAVVHAKKKSFSKKIKNKKIADTRDRTGDITIFSRTLSQLSYNGARVEFRF